MSNSGANFEGFDNIKQKLLDMNNAKAAALQAAGLSLLTAAQTSIIQSGPGWPTWVRKPRRAHKLLWLTGLLLRSLTFGTSGNIDEITDSSSITVGSNVKYAKVQNEPIGKRQLLRQYLFIDDKRLADARAAYLNVLSKNWNA